MTLQQQRRYARRLLKQIGRRSQARDNPISADLLSREIERFLMSHAVQSAALYDIWADQGDEGRATERWLARQQRPIFIYDYRRLRTRPIEWYPKKRATSGYRKICTFGDEEKMWHRLARDLICAQHQPKPHVGDWRGRGRDSQMCELIAAINSPWQAVVVADIRRAFENVKVQAVYDLPYLPELLIRRAIDHRSRRFVRRERSHPQEDTSSPDNVEKVEMAPSGLMEGSPASNAIFSVLMDDLPDHLDKSIQAFVYCDNIILLAPNILQAHRAKSSLARYLTSHRAGPFEISAGDPALVTEQFEHLGYSVRMRPHIDVGLSDANWRALARKAEVSPDCIKLMEWINMSFPRCAGLPREVLQQSLIG
jgi:hypothetical protein